MAVGITGPFVMPLAAQTNAAVAEIPFAFEVGDRTMPAGQYTIKELSAYSSIFKVENEKGKGIFASFGVAVDGHPDKPSLTFVCFGKEHILTKVTPPNSNIAFELSKKTLESRRAHSIGVASMVSVKLTAH